MILTANVFKSIPVAGSIELSNQFIVDFLEVVEFQPHS